MTFWMKTDNCCYVTANPTRETFSFVSGEEDTKGSVVRNSFLLFMPCFRAIMISGFKLLAHLSKNCTIRFTFRGNAL